MLSNSWFCFFVRSFNKDGKLNQSIFIEHFPHCMLFSGMDLRTYALIQKVSAQIQIHLYEIFTIVGTEKFKNYFK